MRDSIVRPAVFVFIDKADPLRLWTGSHPRDLPADEVDLTGGEYLGLGLTDIPVIDRLLNGDAGEYTFMIPGVTPEALALLGDPEETTGSLVYIGQVRFDAAWQSTGEVEWLTTYRAETLGFASTTDAEGQREATVQMTVSSAMTDRRRPRMRHWSALERARVDPLDKAFEHVNRYSLGARRQYPA